MKYKREDRVKILEYKFIFEEDLQVKKEYEEGAADLNYRLSFFRKKLQDKSIPQHQKDLYDAIFIGQQSTKKEIDSVTNDDSKQGLTQSALKVTSDVKPWAKKIYRQIIMATHPDKTSEIQSNNLRQQLTDQYRITQNAYNQEAYGDLIMIAFDLNIDLPAGVVDEEITPTSKNKKKNIAATRSKLGWQWYHVPKTQRDAELKKILVNMGFSFTDIEIKDVIKRKYVKRKPGTRPEKLRRKRVNSIK